MGPQDTASRESGNELKEPVGRRRVLAVRHPEEQEARCLAETLFHLLVCHALNFRTRRSTPQSAGRSTFDAIARRSVHAR